MVMTIGLSVLMLPTLTYPLVTILASQRPLEILQVCPSIHLFASTNGDITCLDNHDIISVKVYDIDSEDDEGDDKEKKEV